MSLFNFVLDAGEKISDFVTGNGKAEEAIIKRIQQLNLGVTQLEVDVKGSRATLRGNAPSNDAREKAILAAGNFAGINEVDAQLQVVSDAATQVASATASADSTFYQVKSGDTLSKIAKQFYGDANRYSEIFKANQPMLSHPDKIYPGQSLRIPAATRGHQAA